MFKAFLYLDSDRRIRLFREGGYELERLVTDVGWVLANDEDWPEITQAFAELIKLLRKHQREL